MSDEPSHTDHTDEPRLYDLLDDAGKAWLDRLVDAINAGAYEEAVKVFEADEAAIERDLAS